jgi:hypothetical protein
LLRPPAVTLPNATPENGHFDSVDIVISIVGG